MRFITIITQFQVTTAMNYTAYIRCINVNYVVDHEQARSLLFQCILSILRMLVIF
jgi:hypothetical protein